MTTRRILLLGATGGTGRQVLLQALEKGYEVTAFVRSPQRLAEVKSSGLKVLTGSLPGDDAALAAAIRGADVVISALGAGNSLKSSGLMERSAPAIVRAMQNESVRRLIVVSAFGVGETLREAPILPGIVMRLLLSNLFADKEAGEKMLRQSALDWTLLYPVTLTNGPRTGRYKSGERLSLHGFPRISRADVADFALAQVDDRTYLRKVVVLSS
jgi:putative NADH-flavin reductase